MNFKEFLWAKGYSEDFIKGFYKYMLRIVPEQQHH